MPKMRTIDQAYAWLKENDPDTAFTKTALRRLVTTGQIPSVRVGQKYLVNLDTLTVFLSECDPNPLPGETTVVSIRPIARN